MKTIRFVDEARSEFLYEVEYYESIETGLGKKFISAVRKATARALAFPLTGSPSPARTRKIVTQPVSIFDSLSPNRGRDRDIRRSSSFRKPNYWIDRVSTSPED